MTADIFEVLELLHERRSTESNLFSQLMYLHCLHILTNENVHVQMTSYCTKVSFLQH